MTTSNGIPSSYQTPINPPPGSADDSSTADVAKQQAGQVVEGASDAGKQVAAVAGDQAQHVAGEAKNQAQDLLHQTRDELTTQAAAQQTRVAGSLRALSAEFVSMARGCENPGLATDLTRQAAGHAETVASWLDEREPGQIVDEITRFARRKPGTFLALAAGAGLLAGRLGRGLAASDSDTSTNSARSRPLPSRAVDTPTAPLPPLQPPAAGYGSPPPAGYGAGVHSAADSTRSESSYVVRPQASPDAGYAQRPSPGVNP
jgi:hypothetical protein